MSGVGHRLWRTANGRLVEDADPAAEVLAYGPDDELSEDDAKLLKQRASAPNKGRAKPDTK